MKKWFCLLLVFLMIFSVLNACGVDLEDTIQDSLDKSPDSISSEGTTDYALSYADAESFEAALNNGEKGVGKIVQFIVNDYKSNSALGISCLAGEHLNFISENEIDVSVGDIVIGKVTKEPSKMFGSWEIPFEALSITKSNEVSRTQKNGFDSASNEIYMLAGYTIEIPKYWQSERYISGGIQRYAETGGKVAMLQISAQAETDDSYSVTFNGLMEDNDNMIAMIESTTFKKVIDYEVIDTGVVKGILYKGTIIEEESGVTGYAEWFSFAAEEERTWCTLILCQTDNTEFQYTNDFMETIKSIKVKESAPQNSPISETQSTEIVLTMSADDFEGMNYKEAEKIFREMGFTSFEYRTVNTEIESAADTISYIEITEWLIGNSDFVKGDEFNADSTVTFFSYKYEAPVAPSPVFYSTNDYETAQKGNTGVFSYKNKTGSYDVYWIIDFDEGYVYFFTEGNGENYCDKVKLTSGTLNDRVTITWNLDGEKTNWYLHFKYVNSPVTLVVNDHLGLTTEFTTTDLDDALALRDTKKIQNS